MILKIDTKNKTIGVEGICSVSELLEMIEKVTKIYPKLKKDWSFEGYEEEEELTQPYLTYSGNNTITSN